MAMLMLGLACVEHRSMPFLYSGGYSLLIAVVQVISSTSGRCEWWFVVLWMVVDVAVASRRLV
jgi:hypothetical protein